ncbi:hypothetical protein NLX86_30700 [Streptomyces sp. A3M-1-3]|uniref:hypothetical protein n=1 Tax=Streptomyces sp. A3M-1-3 TaxID=2962044 RepID=UPI0020B7B9CF|nr:hypothetical protein [Streptomyces sp. A3M-1-3]MCP3822296.1 hypothetical protein [Streptomyces sp. A3M-1-3]
MPRGRHRHSPPLHRLLTPSTVAGVSLACAAVAWLVAEPVALRLLVAAAAAAAVVGAALMRSWDRVAGRKVAELTRARAADEWKTDERIAELEADLEESRELRTRLDAKLRAKRLELAGLRGEHAELLRRYATAETERAGALEGRRLLAIEAASPAKELPAVSADRTASGAPTPAAYARAAEALRHLTRNAAAQEARCTVEEARRRDLAERAREAEEPQGKHAAAAGAEHTRPSSALPARRPVPAATAIAPYAPVRRSASRIEGGFDFFGTKAGAKAAIEAVQNEDLADVVGAEALAAHKAEAGAGEFKALPPANRTVGQVIDLTAHDETEQIDVAQLRTAIS